MLDIFVTYYNNPEFLEECLSSIKKQSFKDYTVFILDDASPECPAKVVNKWQSHLPIKYTRTKENVGSLLQIQKIYSKTNAPYFIWLHHDDVWRETFLETVFVDGLLEKKSCSFSYSLYATKLNDCVEETTKHFVPVSLSGPQNILYHILFSNWIQWSFTVIKRKAFDEVGGFRRIIEASSVGAYDPNRLMAFDSYSWARLSLVGKALANVERLGVRRLHGESFGRINKHRHLEEVSLFLDQVFSDTDIFADPARYFAKATQISRIFTKSKLIETIQNTFEKSLFSQPTWCDQSINEHLKTELLKIALTVLDDFFYDDMIFDSRKLLSSLDKKRYSGLLSAHRPRG